MKENFFSAVLSEVVNMIRNWRMVYLVRCVFLEEKQLRGETFFIQSLI
jgi:hypothetical protein